MPRNKNPEETIKKILDVSQELFLKKGFEKTTILDIVNDLGGMTRGAFYHHFKSKEEVFAALTERFFYELSPILKLQKRTDLSGLEKILTLMKFSLSTDNTEMLAVQQLSLSLVSSPYFLAEHIKSNREVAEIITLFFAEGMADGSIRPGNPKILADLFMLTFNFWLFPALFPCDREEFADRLKTIHHIFDSLGCPLVDEELEGSLDRIVNLFQVAPTPRD
ncbi:MAG: TetR/AcrR family transcriptional regulator [Oscillospiraceae bacterium]|nr:TetR/AcrR family transcriptional regulator [Oscillospiraceae bacterium]